MSFQGTSLWKLVTAAIGNSYAGGMFGWQYVLVSGLSPSASDQEKGCLWWWQGREGALQGCVSDRWGVAGVTGKRFPDKVVQAPAWGQELAVVGGSTVATDSGHPPAESAYTCPGPPAYTFSMKYHHLKKCSLC